MKLVHCVALARPLAVAEFVLVAIQAGAQTLPPVTPERLTLVSDRVEALSIFSGDYGASGGAYAFHGLKSADVSVAKLGGGGDLSNPRSLGLWDFKWNPTMYGNIGYISGEGPVQEEPLTGNKIDVSTFALELGGGARFWFTDHLSLAPSLGGIYGHTENTFKPTNPAGEQYAPAMEQAGWVNWSLDTWSVVPGVDAQYLWTWGRTIFQFNSTFSYFHTESFSSSSPLVSVNGNSQTWENKLDVDVPLGWKLFGRELHTGGFFSRRELYGNLSSGVGTDHVYTVNGRLVLDFLGKLWALRWLGIGGSYFWSDDFNGWSVGIDVRFKF